MFFSFRRHNVAFRQSFGLAFSPWTKPLRLFSDLDSRTVWSATVVVVTRLSFFSPLSVPGDGGF